MQYFDAHTHLDMKHYDNDRDRVIARARDAGLVGMVTSSTGPGSFRRTLGIVEKYPGLVHHSAGCIVSRLTPGEAEKIVVLTRRYASQIVAVGEVGLDYYWVRDAGARRAQEPLFLRFIELASELALPMVVHARRAEREAAEMLERHFDGDVLMHCFDGPREVAQQVADNGWSVTLPANFSRYRNRREAAKLLPLTQLMLETDGPYLSPTSGRNEPANVRLGCRALAELLGLEPQEVAKVTTDNALRFYRLGGP